MMDSEKEFIVCEDLDIVSKGDAPGAKKVRTPGESISGVSDKENQSEVSRKIIGLGREKKKVGSLGVLVETLLLTFSILFEWIQMVNSSLGGFNG